MSDSPVQWHEGMFLTPQHFQAADRSHARQRRLGSQWDRRYNWGLQSIEFDRDALANHRLVVRGLQARMPEGTLVSFPEDGVLGVLDLQAALRRSESAVIYLGLPIATGSRANTTENAVDPAARFNVEAREVQDDNTGESPQAIQVLKPNARLLAQGEDLAGYEALPIARVRRSEAAAGGAPILDPKYIPPLLSCDAWPALQVGVLTQLLERLEKKAEVLAGQADSRDLGFDSQGQGERLLLEQLRTLQEAVGLLTVDVTSQGLAPIDAYRELARLVGRLSAFTADKRLRTLPTYDHDRLGPCFHTALGLIEELLARVATPAYEERLFTAEQALLRVDLEPAWLEPNRRLVLGVESSLPADEIERLLASGRNVKFGSGGRAEGLFLHGEAGLEPRRLTHTPRALPVRRGLSYYELATDTAPGEWRQVERSLSLAARLGDHLVVDELAGSKSLVLDIDGKSATLRLSLFVLTETTNVTTADAVEISEPVLTGA